MVVPEEIINGKQDGEVCNRDVGVLRNKWLENMMARDVTDPTKGLRKTWFENKIARCVFVLEGDCWSANRADWYKKITETRKCRK